MADARDLGLVLESKECSSALVAEEARLFGDLEEMAAFSSNLNNEEPASGFELRGQEMGVMFLEDPPPQIDFPQPEIDLQL
jgi:hypothetical protein